MQFRCAVINGFKRHLRVNFTSSTAAICLHKVSQARVHTAVHARRTLASQTPMQPSACIRCRKLKCRQQRLREEQRTVTRRKLAPYRALLEHRVYRSHRGNFCDSFASVCTHQRCTDRKCSFSSCCSGGCEFLCCSIRKRVLFQHDNYWYYNNINYSYYCEYHD